jgi:hypothetical protein
MQQQQEQITNISPKKVMPADIWGVRATIRLVIQAQKSAGKVLASIFWEQDGILITDYFPNGQTINAEY